MFGFLSSDWFTFVLEIIFLIFIVYDLKKYFETKKREYIVNIALTVVFFVWAIIPFYNSYITWEDINKKELLLTCKEDDNKSVCECIDDKIFKEYSFDEYQKLDKNSSEFREFIIETREECLDDSWF